MIAWGPLHWGRGHFRTADIRFVSLAARVDTSSLVVVRATVSGLLTDVRRATGSECPWLTACSGTDLARERAEAQRVSRVTKLVRECRDQSR